MNKNLVIPQGKIADFCRRRHIRQLSVFGSALTDNFTPQSDVDILVEFKKGHEPGFDFFQMQLELSELIGRKVELHTAGFLSRYFRDAVAKQAEVQYAES